MATQYKLLIRNPEMQQQVTSSSLSDAYCPYDTLHVGVVLNVLRGRLALGALYLSNYGTVAYPGHAGILVSTVGEVFLADAGDLAYLEHVGCCNLQGLWT